MPIHKRYFVDTCIQGCGVSRQCTIGYLHHAYKTRILYIEKHQLKMTLFGYSLMVKWMGKGLSLSSAFTRNTLLVKIDRWNYYNLITHRLCNLCWKVSSCVMQCCGCHYIYMHAQITHAQAQWYLCCPNFNRTPGRCANCVCLCVCHCVDDTPIKRTVDPVPSLGSAGKCASNIFTLAPVNINILEHEHHIQALQIMVDKICSAKIINMYKLD